MSVCVKNEEFGETIIDDTETLNDSSPSQSNTPHTDNCSIYDYFKEHPSFAIGAASAFVTILTCIAQLMAYTNSKSILEYWGFSFSYATSSSDSNLYSAIAAMMYTLILTVIIMLFSKACEVYNEQLSPLLVIKHLPRKGKKIKKHKHASSDSLDSLSSTDNSKLQTSESATLTIDPKTAERLLQTQKNITRTFIFRGLLILSCLILASMVLLLFFEPLTSLWTNTLISFTSHTIMLILIYVFESKSSIGEGKIKEKATRMNASALLDQINSQTTYPLGKSSSKNIRIRNSTFIIALTICVITCLVLVVFFAVGVNYDEADKTTFEVVKLDGETYAVVYHNNDSLFLEKANISGDTITIYTNQQRIISNSDISFCVYTFQNVTKAEDPSIRTPVTHSNGSMNSFF